LVSLLVLVFVVFCLVLVLRIMCTSPDNAHATKTFQIQKIIKIHLKNTNKYTPGCITKPRNTNNYKILQGNTTQLCWVVLFCITLKVLVFRGFVVHPGGYLFVFVEFLVFDNFLYLEKVILILNMILLILIIIIMIPIIIRILTILLIIRILTILLYIYIYIYMYTYTCLYIYIYIYVLIMRGTCFIG
jgi:hypothetical protein